jgi:N utilization substance protein B
MTAAQVRRLARISALQALYELDTTGHAVDNVIASRLEEHPLAPEGEAFLRLLVSSVLKQKATLDARIQRLAPAWPVAQIAVIDRNILRIALWEFAVEECTPVKVAINEAVELSKMYGSESTPRFVNGVLGSLTEHTSEIHQVFQ